MTATASRQPRHLWTEEEIDLIRREYQGTHRSKAELAAKLGVTANAIAYQIARHGLAKITDRRRWTPEEDEKLRQLVEQKTPVQIARIMKRSLNSVNVRAKRLQASRRNRDGWYTKKEVCAILGVEHKWLQRRIDNGALPASYHHGRKPNKGGSAAWHIKRKSLKEFLQKYPDELNGRNVDLPAVVEILAGIVY